MKVTWRENHIIHSIDVPDEVFAVALCTTVAGFSKRGCIPSLKEYLAMVMDHSKPYIAAEEAAETEIYKAAVEILSQENLKTLIFNTSTIPKIVLSFMSEKRRQGFS